MRDEVKGLWALVAACSVWGLSGLYYKLLAHVPPIEVLAHRTIWSMVFFGTVLAAQGKLSRLGGALRGRALIFVAIAALVISLNWFGFIWSVQNGHALEASLGYYIFPLITVALGVLVFGEPMKRGQAVAVAIATVAVIYLTWGLGRAPWMSLFLAGTFAIYGLVKKRLAVGPTVSVTAEVVLLTPLALLYLAALQAGTLAEPAGAAHFGSDWRTTVLLMVSGVLTGGPLMLFSLAAQKVRLATVGLVQYLNPTLQLSVAVFAFGEPVTRWHMVALPMIWGALAIYSAASLRRAP